MTQPSIKTKSGPRILQNHRINAGIQCKNNKHSFLNFSMNHAVMYLTSQISFDLILANVGQIWVPEKGKEQETW